MTGHPIPSRRTQLAYAASGKCQQCGKRKPATATLCVSCAAKHSAATSALKARLLDAGLCTQCGQAPLSTVRLCRACQDRHNARVAKTRAKKKTRR
jgi:hypothetical protein